MRRFMILTVFAVVGGALAEGRGEEPVLEQDDSSAWHFRIGPVLAPRVRVKVCGPRVFVPQLPANGSVRSGTGGTVPADPSAGFVGRTYVNGYVNPDEGTDDPQSKIAGLTWNWGADDVASQHVGQQMEFRTDMARWTETTSVSASGSSGSGRESDRDELLGVEAMGGWTFWKNETFDAALDVGFRYYGSRDHNLSSRYGVTATTTRNEYRYVDRYDASGWTDAPSGSHTGTAGGPGRLLGATPTREEELMASSTSYQTYSSSSHTHLDYDIWDLRLGPTLDWKALDRLTVRGGVYGLLGLVDARLTSRNVTSAGSSGAKKTRCDALFGLAFGLSAQYDVAEDLFVMAGVEYDWWSDKTRLRAGGAQAQIELSDFTVSAGVGYQF